MVRAGESPHFIFRRMLISACEDIGLADPHALTVVTSAAAAFDRIGLPEGRYHLTHAALYLATCPKSNSSLGFFDALKAVEKEQTEVPNHLKDANRDGESLGHGEGYLYPHAYRDHWIAQQYLPDELIGRVFYTPGYTGYEEKIRNEVLAKRETQLAAIHEAAEGKKGTFTVEDWQVRTEGSSAEILEQIRDTLIGLANLSADDRVLVYRADGGLLLWPSTRITLNGCTAGIFEHSEALQSALRYAETFEFLNRPIMTALPIASLLDENPSAASENMGASDGTANLDGIVNTKEKSSALFPDLAFDAVISYNPAATAEGFTAFFSRIKQEHTADARILFAFALPQQGLRLSALLPPDEFVNRFAAAEAAFFSDSRNTRTAWTENTVAGIAENAGCRVQLLKKVDYQEKRLVTQAELGRWLSVESEYGTAIRSAFASDEAALEKIIQQLEQRCRKPAVYTRTIVYMSVSQSE